MAYSDGTWQSADGLALHYRHYNPEASPDASHMPPEKGAKLPIICMHGLTRNARDFHDLAEHLVAKGHHVVVPEMRGRGQSDAAHEPDEYVLTTYAADMELLLAELNIDRFIAIGTSMGGLMTMMLAIENAGRIAAAVINDVGPVLHIPGLERIAGNVQRAPSFPTWMHAARAQMEMHAAIHPDWEINEWIGHAKRIMRLTPSGKIVFDHDPRIGQAFGDPSEVASADIWPAWLALKETPLLLVRGELSDLLTQSDAEMAVGALDDATLVIVPRVGHAPMLTEPEALAAIDTLIAQVQ